MLCNLNDVLIEYWDSILRSALGARHPALGARRPPPGARRSALGARRPALGARLPARQALGGGGREPGRASVGTEMAGFTVSRAWGFKPRPYLL